ncbi:myoD family inhibitor domain-containing protein isoform X2 [Anguilla rostrata]|uniref:myoD family inhibitor domain-containing protein isoform X2 n=1 Tax=Anguilla rostrata TaxID=7938 RepID=UPI0030CC2720
MSQKTVLPPEGPAGPARGTPPERSLLLSDFHDACDNRSDSAAPEEEVARSPPESPSEGRGTAPGGNSTNGELVRTQPQRLPQPTASVEPGDGDAGQSQNGRRVGLSNGAGLEPRRHPSTVSHKVQRKLQSSLSVHSDSSRKSKTSSGSSHKPGSSPEERCASLILACLSCRCADLSAGLLESCSACLHAAACDGCCSRCWAELQDTPGEDLRCPARCPAHCDPELCEPCCEPAECLEFCLECVDLCHNS